MRRLARRRPRASERADRGSTRRLSTSGTRRTSKPRRLEQVEVAAAPAAEAEAVARDDDLGAGCAQDALGELLRRRALRAARRSAGRARRRRRASSSSSSRRSSGREQLDAACRATVRGCGSNVTTVGGRPAARAASSTRAVAEVDAVERADRDGARARGSSSLRTSRTTFTRARLRRRASTSPRGAAGRAERVRASTASSTPNGPTSVRRSVRQWPPSASRDRAHVGARADAQVERRRRRRVRRRARARARASAAAASRPRRRAARSLYARSPSIFTADAAGIGSSISPRSAVEPLSSSARPAARAARRPRPRDRRSTSSSVRSISVR